MSILDEFEKEVLNDTKSKKVYEIETEIHNLCFLLKKIRIDKNIAQTEIAEKTGLTQQMISKIESYNGNPTLTSLVKYCDCLGISLYEIIRKSYYEDCSK